MTEPTLQEGEIIELREMGDFCLGKAIAPVTGEIFLTNKRLIIRQVSRSAQAGILMLVMFGAVGGLLLRLFASAAKKRASKKAETADKTAEFEFPREEIIDVGVERGVRRMLEVKFKDGSIFKLNLFKDNKRWRSALLGEKPA
ncbi:MAG: hypothetical protein LBL34_02415 [Clostridiales bacterium]|jgi:hypothetical protein|nr:hypothetical protein [Clostridiales bacterium]